MGLFNGWGCDKYTSANLLAYDDDGCNGNASKIVYTSSITGWCTLYITAYSASTSGTYTLKYKYESAPTAPSNATCANATTLDCGATLNGTTVGTPGTAHGLPSSASTSNYGVWYTFTGTGGDTKITVTPASGYDTKISVASGSCGSFTWVGYADNGGSGSNDTYTFSTTSGTRYNVYVAHYSSTSTTTGTFTISRECPPPANSTCATATRLDCGATLNGTTIGTTNVAHGTGASVSNYGVWYTFTGNGGQTRIDATGSNYDIRLVICKGSCGSLTLLYSNDSYGSSGTETQTFTTERGVNYYVYIAYYSSTGSTTGGFTISRSCETVPPVTMECGTTYSGTLGTSGAWNSYTSCTYSEPGEEHIYAYTAPITGSYTFTTTSSGGDPDFFLMTANSNTATNVIGACWGSGNQTVTLTGGQTYYLVADNYSSTSTASYSVSVACPATTYTIVVSANPSAGGTVSGGGSYSSGASCTVLATTNTCYTFSGWYENGSRVSTSASYTFTVSGNRTLEARYTQNTYTVSVSANPSAGGSVSGGGTFNCGTSPIVTATPNSGYHFVNWTESGSQVSTSASYTISNISANHTLVANFEEISSGGEDCPIIGTGTNTTYYGPYNSLWGYSFVEQIYPASEIGRSGTINSVAFNMSSTDAQTNNIVVYMKHTAKSSFANNTDWESVSAANIVYQGTFTFEQGWNTITLNTPFDYNGTDNIVIGIHENTTGYSTRYFYYTEAAGALISAHSDSADPDPYNLGSYSGTKYVQNYRLNAKFCISSSSSSPITICEDFEGYTGTTYNVAGPVPMGWDVIYTGEDEYIGGSPHVATTIYGSRVISTGNGLSFTADNDDYYDGYAVLPNRGVPVSVTFKYRFEGDYGTLTVGYITNLNDVTTYHVLETVPRSTTQGTPKEYTFATGSIPVGARLAFKYTCPETNTVWTCGIDDVCVTYIPVSCGAIVYYDDFGGNDVQDERYAGPHKLAELGYTSGGGIVPATWTYAGDYTRCNYLAGYEYTYSQDFGDCRHHGNSSCMSNYPNVYAINKNTYHDASSNGWSVNNSDYSFGDDVNRGYMFQGDGTGDFYVKTINNVPAGSYTLSAWFLEVSSGVKYRLSVSGATTASSGIQNVSGTQGVWVRKSLNFTLNSSGNITISIYGDGDFAADEILLATTENAPPAASLSLDHLCSNYPTVSYLASAYGPGEYGTFSYTTHNANGCEYTVERDATWGYFHIYYDYTLNCNGDNTYYVQDVPMWDCSAATIREASSCSGKRFVKWATRANGSGTSYQPGDQISLTTNIYLYAIYEDSDPCDNITAMTCGQTYSGTLGTSGLWDSYPNVNNWNWDEEGEEKVYSFTPSVTGTYVFWGHTDFDNSDGDADFFVLTSCNPSGTEVIHWDDDEFDDETDRTANLTAGTTYYLIVDNYDTNEDVDYEVSVSLSSISSITASETTVCTNSQVTLTAPDGGSSYSWSPSGSGRSITPIVTTNTTYTVTVWSGSGCSASNSIAVNVINVAEPTNLLVSNISTTAATVSWTTNGATSWMYSINGGTTWTTINTSSVNLTGLTPGTQYTFLVKAVNGSCESSAVSTIFITLNYIATPSVTSTCGMGQSFTISVSPAASSYQWQFKQSSDVSWITCSTSGGGAAPCHNGYSNGTSQTITINSFASNIDIMWRCQINGSSYTEPVTIHYHALPSVTINSLNSVCSGTSLELSANATSGSGTYSTYQWIAQTVPSGATSGLTPTNSSTITVTPTNINATAAIVIYKVSVTDNAGCSNSATQSISVVDKVTPTFTNPGPICSGSALTLPSSSNNSSALTGTAISGSWSPAVNNTATTTYTFTPNADQCSNSNTIQIIVNDRPSVSPITAPDAICVGEPLDLTTPTVIPNGLSITAEGWEISSSQNGAYTPFTNSNLQQNQDGYYIRYTAANVCGSSSNTGVQITVNAPSISITSTYDYVWRGGTSNWNIASNWYEYNNGTYTVASALPAEAKNYYIALGGTGTCLSDVQQAYMNADATVNTIEIAPGAEVHIQENVTLQLAGSIINNGTFIADNSSTIELNGAADQTLTSAMEFGNVTFAQTANNKKIIAPHGITVHGLATFTKGVVDGDMTFVSGATSSGANLASHVDGQVTKFGNGEFTFPTGSNGVLGTIEATVVNNTDEGIKTRFNNASADGHGYTTEAPDNYPRWWNINDMCSADGGNRFDHVNNFEFWNVDGIAGSTSLSSITIKVDANTASAHFHDAASVAAAVANSGGIHAAAHYDCWKNMGGTANIENGGSTITISGVSSINYTRSGIFGGILTLGSTNENTVLPIELSSFKADCDGKSALVEWTTATERNNDYFVLERSDDAINFTEVARVAGAGNSIEPIDYAYTDYGIHGGDNYYRLVQVDYDGTRTASEIIVANCVEMSAGEPDVLAYPNPFDGELTVVLDNFGNRPARIDVYDVLGKLIYTEKIASPLNSYETILHFENLPPATYTIRVSTADFVINRKVIKD